MNARGGGIVTPPTTLCPAAAVALALLLALVAGLCLAWLAQRR